MSDHNEAMRLADALDAEVVRTVQLDVTHSQAAALLRQQAERIAELERLSTGLSAVYNESMDSLRIVVDERDTLRAEVERLRVDAERYEWLRLEHERHDPVCHLSWKLNNDRNSSEWVNTAQLDTAIDTARKATQ